MEAKTKLRKQKQQEFYFMALVITSLSLMATISTWFGHFLMSTRADCDVITENYNSKIHQREFVLEINDDYEPGHNFTEASLLEDSNSNKGAEKAEELKAVISDEDDPDPLSYAAYDQDSEQLNITKLELTLLQKANKNEENIRAMDYYEDDPDPLSYAIQVPYYEQFGFTKRDFYILCKLAEGEYGYGCVKGIAATIYTVLNRVESDEFPNDIESVVSAPKQFSLRYVTEPFPEPSQAILDAFEYVAQGIDFSNGALYFCNPDLVDAKTLKWFESLEVTAEFPEARFYK